MYRSPIEIIHGQLETQLEGEIMKAVYSYHINVDKKELIRALNHDRNQYNEGYLDGKNDAMSELVRCKECKHRVHLSNIYPEDIHCGYLQTDSIEPDGYCSNGEREA